VQAEAERRVLGPLDRFDERLDFDQQVAGDHLLGFGERAIRSPCACFRCTARAHAAGSRREADEIGQHPGLLRLP
jgi:hypothetical protein